MKTLVVHQHAAGPHVNGRDGCFARSGNFGICPGVKTAAWLNSLDEDDAIYVGHVTCGQVRANYLRANAHVVAKDERLARLSERRQEALAELKRCDELLAETRT